MYSKKIGDMTRGWFVGNFEPTAYETNDVEAAVRVLEKGYCEQRHLHRVAAKVIVVLSGRLRMFEKEWVEEDIIVMEPGDISSIEALETSRIVMMTLPGIKNDKVYVDLQDVTEGGQNLQRIYDAESVRKILNIMGRLLEFSYLGTKDGDGIEKTEQDYIQMQKQAYENPEVSPEDIVGQYEWHEEYPYETFLLYKNGDIRKPIFENTKDKTALDFACGPGRMVKRMMKVFQKVDGCDISSRLIQEAKERVPEADFYVTNGNDLGDVPLNYYDYIYCTISMQHIASYQIRQCILKNMNQALKKGGKIVLQMAYNPAFPYVKEREQYLINDKQVRIYEKDDMADYFGNDFDAKKTNGLHDVGIGENDLPKIKEDFSRNFSNVTVWFSNVRNYYNNLNGRKHSEYWATDWVYIYAEKSESISFN